MAILTFPDEIYELYRELLSDLPQGTAELTRQPSKDPGGGEDIVITPANPNSAQICLHPGGDIVYTAIGRYTSMEFFVSLRKQEEQGLQSLRKISRAVVDGKFSEDVWMSNGKLVKSSGIIEIDGKTRRIGRFLTFSNPFRRKLSQHLEYSPYVQLEHRDLGPLQ
jgi:hypothetical protein